jgi:signal transduction protein with GAF and PtsI domain
MLSVGMRYKGRAIGVLRVYTNEEKHFSQLEIDLLRAVAAQAAAAIENTTIAGRIAGGRGAGEASKNGGGCAAADGAAEGAADSGAGIGVGVCAVLCAGGRSVRFHSVSQ